MRAELAGAFTNAWPRAVITTTSARPSSSAGPPRHGPSTTRTVGTWPDAPASARATVPQPQRASSPLPVPSPARTRTPTTGTPASTPARTVRAMTSADAAWSVVGAARNQATGWSTGSHGGTPSPASTAPGRPRPIGSRATAGPVTTATIRP